MTSSKPTLAVVIPVFNEQEVIPELLRRLLTVFDNLSEISTEVVFVDDGSSDQSPMLLAQACATDPRLQLIRLSRNFGHQPALTAGIDHVSHADAVITMDADLQDPPELIPELVDAWRAGSQVVLAVRRSRQDNGVRRFGFDLFHRLFGSLTDFPIECNTGTFGLLDRQAVAALCQLPERHRFFPGLRSWIGFTQARIYYDRQERAAGTPGQTLRRLVHYAFDALFSFSYLPLRLMTYIGVFVAGAGFVAGLFFIIRRLLGIEIAQTGFTTLATLSLFIGGIQLIGIGILGEYLGRIYDEVKKRPLYVVRKNRS